MFDPGPKQPATSGLSRPRDGIMPLTSSFAVIGCPDGPGERRQSPQTMTEWGDNVLYVSSPRRRGSNVPLTPTCAVGWILGTSPRMTYLSVDVAPAHGSIALRTARCVLVEAFTDPSPASDSGNQPTRGLAQYGLDRRPLASSPFLLDAPIRHMIRFDCSE